MQLQPDKSCLSIHSYKPKPALAIATAYELQVLPYAANTCVSTCCQPPSAFPYTVSATKECLLLCVSEPSVSL